jgi:hypothetical protein
MTYAPADIYRRLRDFWLGDEALSVFLVLLFLAIFLGPFLDSTQVRLLTSLLFSLLMVSGVITISRRPSIRFVAGMVACTAITLRWLTHVQPTPSLLRWSSLASFVFMVTLTLVILYKVFMDDKPVTTHRVVGAVAAYLMFGITWSILYGFLDQVLPNAFNLPLASGDYGPARQEVFAYYSFITLTTVGYGDISPTHDVSRMFAVMEALVGQLYPATLLARLVSLAITQQQDALRDRCD